MFQRHLSLAVSLAAPLTACLAAPLAIPLTARLPRLSLAVRTGTLLLGLACGLVSLPTVAADLEAVRKAAQARLAHAGEDGSTITITSVRPAPLPGLYEIVTEDHALYYVDEAANFLITNGSIIDLKSLKNLTAERIREVTAIPLDSLPLNLAIKHVKGNGKRRLVVFSDSDCPFCKKLENELASVTDVTIYTFLYPIVQLHPNAPEHTRRIWCASDRQKAWSDYWAKNALPESRDCDVSALETVQRLGQKNGIQATPTLIFADGHVVPGALPTAQLEKNLGPR